MLDATAPAPKGPNYQFDRIEFILYRESLKIPLDDINHIYPRPKDINLASAETQKVQTPTFKSYVLVVNLPIESERKAIVECIDSEIFRTLVRPDLRQPTGFLPPGMYGAKANVRKLQRKSNQCKGLPSSTVNFVVLLASDENPARVALNKSSKSLAQIMKVNSVSSQSLANLIFDRKPKIVMVGLDSSGSISSNSHESSIFFEAFVRNKRMIKTPPPGLLNTVRKASLATQINEKKYLYSKAHEILLQSGYVIPIGYVD
ncbi:MAG: hypothetical protein KDD35_07390, partial [Bdellovibrionales bacterium]|nr:hypothetical protein [Bdellovibrionales bacterium]